MVRTSKTAWMISKDFCSGLSAVFLFICLDWSDRIHPRGG
jgi:hypothetical protein